MKAADIFRWLAFAALFACVMLLPSGWVWTVPIAAAVAELAVTAWEDPELPDASLVATCAFSSLTMALCVVLLVLYDAPSLARFVAFVGAGVLPLNIEPPRRA